MNRQCGVTPELEERFLFLLLLNSIFRSVLGNRIIGKYNPNSVLVAWMFNVFTQAMSPTFFRVIQCEPSERHNTWNVKMAREREKTIGATLTANTPWMHTFVDNHRIMHQILDGWIWNSKQKLKEIALCSRTNEKRLIGSEKTQRLQSLHIFIVRARSRIVIWWLQFLMSRIILRIQITLVNA